MTSINIKAGPKKNTSRVVYHNYNKKVYYFQNFAKLKKITIQKTSNSFGNLHIADEH